MNDYKITNILLRYINYDDAVRLSSILTEDEHDIINRIIDSNTYTDIFASYAYSMISPDELGCILDDIALRV